MEQHLDKIVQICYFTKFDKKKPEENKNSSERKKEVNTGLCPLEQADWYHCY